MKKFLATLLSIAMILTMIPSIMMTASAATVNTCAPETEINLAYGKPTESSGSYVLDPGFTDAALVDNILSPNRWASSSGTPGAVGDWAIVDLLDSE